MQAEEGRRTGGKGAMAKLMKQAEAGKGGLDLLVQGAVKPYTLLLASSSLTSWSKPYTSPLGSRRGKTLNPTPHTLHSTPYTLHPEPKTLNPKPETRNRGIGVPVHCGSTGR